MWYKITICFLAVSFLNGCFKPLQAQTQPNNVTVEQNVESITERNEDAEIDDDTYLQQLQLFLKHPLNLNVASAGDLNELLVLSPLQINSLLAYRKIFGELLSIYELQAVPGWDIITIDKIRPYVTVSSIVPIIKSLKKRWYDGEHTLVTRIVHPFEKSKGYLLDSTVATNYYPGSPQKIWVRYKYQYKNLLQYGILAEKDGGEQFFKGAQQMGFDFYSFHVFARNIRAIKAIAIGDYTVNIGQGLIQWQSLAFKKGTDAINIKRQSTLLRPYNSAGEINFHRGMAVTVGMGKFDLTGFVSMRKLDGNFISDTLNNEDYISSLQTSGLHRTKAEVMDKGIQKQHAWGTNVSYTNKKFHAGVNYIGYYFGTPIKKSADPYNLYALSSSDWYNASVDYSYTFQNYHTFGEIAVSKNSGIAQLHGVMFSASSTVDVSLLYRSISSKYQALYSNAFTENTFPTNESGFYTGVNVRMGARWKFDMYGDVYRFPWLKYRVDKPGTGGADYMISATYQPTKQLQLYVRYRAENKAINTDVTENIISSVQNISKRSLRLHISKKINTDITVRHRAELLWYGSGITVSRGFLLYLDCIYKPLMKKISGAIRVQHFDTEDYNSRLYAYENDVLYSYSIPVFYNRGYRYYMNLSYDVSKIITVDFKIGQTMYLGQTHIGSGLDEIQGNKRTDCKIQVRMQL